MNSRLPRRMGHREYRRMVARMKRSCRRNPVHASQNSRCRRTAMRRRNGNLPSCICDIKRLASLHEMSIPTGCNPGNSGAATRASEPVLLQAKAQRHPGPIQDYPEVGRCDREFLTDLIAVELHDLSHHENAGGVRRQLVEAKLDDIEELRPPELHFGVPPIPRRAFPVPGVVEEGVEVLDAGL